MSLLHSLLIYSYINIVMTLHIDINIFDIGIPMMLL